MYSRYHIPSSCRLKRRRKTTTEPYKTKAVRTIWPWVISDSQHDRTYHRPQKYSFILSFFFFNRSEGKFVYFPPFFWHFGYVVGGFFQSLTFWFIWLSTGPLVFILLPLDVAKKPRVHSLVYGPFEDIFLDTHCGQFLSLVVARNSRLFRVRLITTNICLLFSCGGIKEPNFFQWGKSSWRRNIFSSHFHLH